MRIPCCNKQRTTDKGVEKDLTIKLFPVYILAGYG